MRFVRATAGVTYDATNHLLLWSVPKLDSTSTLTLDVTVAFPDTISSPRVSVNRVSMTSDAAPRLSAQARTDVLIPAKLRIWKVASVGKAVPGDTLAYMVSVQNVAGIRADSIVISDQLPAQVRYLGSSPAGIFDPASGILTWRLDSLPSGARVDLRLTALVGKDLPAGEYSFTNIAGVRWFGGQSSSYLDAQSSANVNLLVPFLTVHKQAIRRIVEIGDAALYAVVVSNASPVTIAYNVELDDITPLAFHYIRGSAFRNSVKFADPAGSKELRWKVADSLVPGQSVTLTYRLMVGAGALDGNGVNTARVHGTTPGGVAIASDISSDRVEIREGVFTDHGLVVGKVFYDDNENAYQDPGEDGIKGVELLTEDGTRVVTGDDGKYSLPDVAPGEHVIRVRQASLPEGAELLLGYGEFAQEPSSRFVKVPESGIARVDFYVRRAVVRKVSVSHEVAKFGPLQVRRLTEPKNILFVKDEESTPIRLQGTQFETGKAILKPAGFPTLKAVADLAREFQNQMIAISGHTDSLPIKTKDFPSNQLLSEARANAVKSYLVEKEHIDPARIRTLGFGETAPVASNATKAGRAQNRRVEITMTGTKDVFENYFRTVEFRIPLRYEGAVPLRQIGITDRLDTALHFVAGSGRIGSSPSVPKVGDNTLTWTVDGIGTSYDGILSYQATVSMPKETSVRARSSSSVTYETAAGRMEIAGEAATVTVVGRMTREKPLDFTLSGVLFEAGKAILKAEAANALKNAAEVLKNFPNATATVEGFTDSRPISTREFPSNVDLSNARAKSVIEMLVSQFGIARNRLSAYGWGELKPVMPNTTERGRAANRRVQVRIYKAKAADESSREGEIDSSAAVVERVEGSGSDLRFDTPATGGQGDRLIVGVTVRRDRDPLTVSAVLVDSLAEGLSPVRGSVSLTRGLDSIWTDGSKIYARLAVGDSVAAYRYVIDVKQAGTLSSVDHSVEIIRTQRSGYEIVDRFRLALMNVK